MISENETIRERLKVLFHKKRRKIIKETNILLGTGDNNVLRQTNINVLSSPPCVFNLPDTAFCAGVLAAPGVLVQDSCSVI